MKRYLILLFLLSFMLAGCVTLTPAGNVGNVDYIDHTDSTTSSTEAQATARWVKDAGHTFYIKEDGSLHTGWLELNGKRYYLNNDGILQTGWLELDGQKYYLKDDGSVTLGKAIIDRNAYHFTSTGVSILVVNPWNIIPNGHTPDLVDAEDGYMVDSSCKDDLLQMLADCRTAGYDARITSAYRKHETQVDLYNKKVWYYIDRGYAVADARKKAATIVAMPGTSEHQLGLAVDLVDSDHWVLDETQENTPAQKWLMQHCWEYGFILRYPNGKTEHTGIVYEPWHYRYVGKELALELKDSDLCLEEYFAGLN